MTEKMLNNIALSAPAPNDFHNDKDELDDNDELDFCQIKHDENSNDTISCSRCPSIISVTPSSSNSPTISNSQISHQMSFSKSTSISSLTSSVNIKNINISNNNYDNDNDSDMCMNNFNESIENDAILANMLHHEINNTKPGKNNNNKNYDDSNNDNLRRSSRISKKRKLGHIAYYKFEDFYPPKKRRKTRSISTSISPTTKSPNLLKAQNAKIKKMRKTFRTRRDCWIKSHFSSFEPFMTRSAKAKYKKPSKSDIIKTSTYESQPVSLQRGTLRDYQLVSVNWLRNLRDNGVPAILADEMGLGKTVQSIATIAALYIDNNDKYVGLPHLIIVPLSVSEAWMDEFKKWLPSVRCILFHGPKQQRDNIMKYKLICGAFDVCVTTYEMASSHKGFLSKFMWNYLILDEGHKIKNERTNWHNSLKCINSRALQCILLTGTPIQNDTHELYALLSFMFGDDLFDVDIFDKCYQHLTQTQDKYLLSKIPYLLSPFFIRRLKEEVELSLPKKEEIIIKLNMSPDQRKYYKSYLCAHANLIDQVSQNLYDGNSQKAKNTVFVWKKLRSLYTELRKIALHPFLLENLNHNIHSDNGEKIISHSCKLQILDKLLFKLKSENHRVLLFSCFTMVLDLLQVYCDYKGYRYCRLDGQTSRIRRKIDISRFNDDPASPFFIYLISNRAGGLGINLQAADTVIHFDTDWNPQCDLQAQARAHRIGQKNMVKIYRLISANTVEERILFRSQQKLYLDAVVNKGAKLLNDCGGDDGEEEFKYDLNDNTLLKSIKFGAQKMFSESEKSGDINELDLEALLQRSHKIGDGDEGKKDRCKLLKDLDNNNVASFDFSMKLVSGNVFEGKTYEKKEFDQKDLDEINNNNNNGKRACFGRETTRTVIVDGQKFETRVLKNINTDFWKMSSEHIYDSRNNNKYKHDSIRCWGCDKHYDEGDEYIECNFCPKTFHSDFPCWRGEQTNMGVMVCSQHHCNKCGLKASECGMILICLGCPESYCYDCAPTPYYKKFGDENNGDGLYYVDNCAVAEHYGYYLPRSSYMYVFCSLQCKKFYETDYGRRELPDLSLTFGELPLKLQNNRHNCHRIKKLRADDRVCEDFMPCKLMERIKKYFDGDSELICEFYILLYQTQRNEDEKRSDEASDYIKIEHFEMNTELKCKMDQALNICYWKQCEKCKKWSVIQIGIDEDVNNEKYLHWTCDEIVNFSCESVQKIPDKNSHSTFQLNILKLQRELMSAKYLQQNDKITRISNEMRELIIEEKRDFLRTNCTLNDLITTRFKGISKWKGFDEDEDAMCEYYEYLTLNLRKWRMETLKSLMDVFGFLIETKKRKKSRKRGQILYQIDRIAFSYNKDKVIDALVTFIMVPNKKHLILTSQYFAK